MSNSRFFGDKFPDECFPKQPERILQESVEAEKSTNVRLRKDLIK